MSTEPNPRQSVRLDCLVRVSRSEKLSPCDQGVAIAEAIAEAAARHDFRIVEIIVAGDDREQRA